MLIRIWCVLAVAFGWSLGQPPKALKQQKPKRWRIGVWRRMAARVAANRVAASALILQRLSGAAATTQHVRSMGGVWLYLRGTSTARARAAALAASIDGGTWNATSAETRDLAVALVQRGGGDELPSAAVVAALAVGPLRSWGMAALAVGAVTKVARRKRRLRVLCLDGGGMKGRNLLLMIQEIERRAGRPISELFDVVCGTSIGGCGALFIARFGRDATEVASSAFRGLQERCFATSSRVRFFQEGLWCTDERADLVTELLGGADLPLDRTRCDDHAPLAFVVAARRSPQGDPEPFLFRTYQTKKRKNAPSPLPGTSNATFVHAVAATSAAPTYFAPVDDGEDPGGLVDGGCVFNNPSLLALHELRAVFPDRRIGVVVSLGCGREPADKRRRRIYNNHVEEETITHQYAEALVDSIGGATYERFDPPLEEYISPGEHRESILNAMELKTQEWLQSADVQARLDHVVARLNRVNKPRHRKHRRTHRMEPSSPFSSKRHHLSTDRGHHRRHQRRRDDEARDPSRPEHLVPPLQPLVDLRLL